MKRRGSVVLIGAMLWASMAAMAFAWEKGTHAYIADLLRKKGGAQNLEELYGAMAPDAFNFIFADPGPWLYEQTHFLFGKVWDAAKTGTERSAAAGFLTHNNVWGADTTAHTASRTLDPGEGYIISKAKALHGMLMTDPTYAAFFGDPTVLGVALEICHNLVESAGDVILKSYDPALGRKLVSIVNRPKPTIQNLMVKAYAADLAEHAGISRSDAAGLIIQAENEFRLGAIGYGYLLQGDDETLIANIVAQFKALAGAFLAAYGLPVPDDETLEALIRGGLDASMFLCAGDYMAEVNATVEFVAGNLKTYGIK